MSQYVAVQTSTGRIEFKLGAMGKPDPEGYTGPLTGAPPPFPTSQVVWMAWQGRLRMSEAPTLTSEYMWTDAGPAWVERAPLDDQVVAAIDRIDSAADAARMAVIAKQTNTPEYQRAEAQARAFKAAGYPAGDVPRNVAGWVAAKWRDEMTAQQAADDIIATADRWYQLLDDIRDMRLAAKEDVRHAANPAEVATRARQLETALYTLMEGSE
jgi:hypothetical protein